MRYAKLALFFFLLPAALFGSIKVDSGGASAVSGAAITPDSITITGTGATVVIDNGLTAQTLTNSLPAQTSGNSVDTSKVFTLAQSTSGTNGNGYFVTTSGSGGDYSWLFHANCASGSTGCIGLAVGMHEDGNTGILMNQDVAISTPIHLYHMTATKATPFIRIDAETDFRTHYLPTLGPPSYSGTNNGAAFEYAKRDVVLAKIDTDGSLYSYADATDYVRTYVIDNVAGVLKSNLPIARWDAGTGSYIDFSSDLAGNLLTVVATNGDATVTPSGGQIAIVGGTGIYPRTTAQLEAITPAYAGETYFCSNCTTPNLFFSTSTTVGSFVSAADGTTAN